MSVLRSVLWVLLVGLTVQQDSSRDRKMKELIESLQVQPRKLGKPLMNPGRQFSTYSNSSEEVTSSEEVDGFKTYQDFFRTMYGTSEGVNYLKKRYGPNGLQQARAKYGINKGMEDVRLANSHFLRMRSRGECRVPAPRIVRVKDFYPDASKEYMPRCTVLHRCGDGSGCCTSDAYQCVPSQVQEVTLHFYTLTVGKAGMSGNTVEELLFENHTACHCSPINDLPRMQNYPLAGEKCNDCPVPFNRRVFPDGSCGCDCFHRQRPCVRIKKGREPLSHIERRCVEARQCHIPDCEFGLYNTKTGYCPRKNEDRPRSHQWTNRERD